MERSLRWVLDADITVDYRGKRIIFSRKKRLPRVIAQVVAASSGLFGTFALLVILAAVQVGVDQATISAFAWDAVKTCVALSTISAVAVIIVTSDIPLVRNLVFRIRTRRVRRQISITNPEGSVVYRTRSSSPLIDLEYSGNIDQLLDTVTLIKDKPKGKLKGTKALTIRLSGKAQGTLTIKEY